MLVQELEVSLSGGNCGRVGALCQSVHKAQEQAEATPAPVVLPQMQSIIVEPAKLVVAKAHDAGPIFFCSACQRSQSA